MLPRAGVREGGLTGKGHKGTFWGDGNVPYLDLGGGHTVKIHLAVCTLKICAFGVWKCFFSKVLSKREGGD